MRRTLFALLGLTIALATPAAARTEQALVESTSVTVHTTLADLANDQSLQALYLRIDAAARSVCADLYEEESASLIRSCQRDAVRRAVRDAAIPELSRHYAALQGGWTPPAVIETANVGS